MSDEFDENEEEQQTDCSLDQTDPEYYCVLDEYYEEELCNEERLDTYDSAEDDYTRLDADLQQLEETKAVLMAERENMDIYTEDDINASDQEMAELQEKINLTAQQRLEAEAKLRIAKEGTVYEAEEETFNRKKDYETDMDWDGNEPEKFAFDRHMSEASDKANMHFRDIINKRNNN